MKNTKLAVLSVFALVSGAAILLLADTTSKLPSETASIMVKADQEAAAFFTSTDLEGKAFDLAAYKGKVLVLNFWATWCGPCRREIPDFIQLQDEYGTQGLQMVGIALDEQGASIVKPFADKFKINYPVVVDAKSEVAALYGQMNAIPVTIVVDRNGKIRSRQVGMRSKAQIEAIAVPLLKEK
jgi:thiol-disulfide isomerase/thioredoxin